MRTSRETKWVKITPARRIAYGILSVVLILGFATFVWLAVQAGRRGLIDSAIMGATLAGGTFAAFTAITGKEQKRGNRL